MENEVESFIEKWVKSRCLSKVPKAIPDKLLGNKDFVMGVLERIPLQFALLEVLPEKLKNDKDVIFLALQKYPANFFSVPEKLLNDKKFVLSVLPFVLIEGHFPKPYQNYSSRSVIRRLPEKIRADKEVRIAIVSKDEYLIQALYAPNACDDRDVALAFIRSGPNAGWMLHYCARSLLDDKELVILAINGCGSSLLRHASARLKADREVVLEAVKHSGCGLEYASEELRDDKEIALLAVAHEDGYHHGAVCDQNCRVDTPYKYVSDRLKKDHDVASLAIKTNLWAYVYAPYEIKMDRELALLALSDLFDSAQLGIPKALFDDKEFVLRFIAMKPLSYQNASDRLKRDSDVYRAALQASSRNYENLPHDLQLDRDIILQVARDDIRNLYPAHGQIIEREGKRFLVVTFKKQNSLIGAAALRAFAGMGANAEERAGINQAADTLAAQAEYEDQTIEIEVGEDYPLGSKSGS